MRQGMKQGDETGFRDEGLRVFSLVHFPRPCFTALVPAFLFLLVAACSSATQDDPNAPNVVLHLAQYESAPNAYLYGGLVNVRYALSIANRTKDPITLNRIEVRTVSSGAYTLRPTSTPMNIEL